MNFHNKISIPLEGILTSILNSNSLQTVRSSIFSADYIDQNNYILCINIYLSVKSNFSNDNEKINDFFNKYNKYLNCSYNDIGEEIVTSIFEEFKELNESLNSIPNVTPVKRPF